MIYVGENKSILCKGDFHPAQIYKGDKKIAGYETVDFSGEGGITLEKCYNDRLHNAVIHGNSIQDGTPTPETPIEVQSVGELVTEGEYAGKYKIPVKARGKNLWDRENYIESSASTNETSCARTFNASDYPWLKDANVLTFSATTFLSENDTRTSPRQSIAVLYTDNTQQIFFGRDIIRGTEERYNLSCTFKKEISQIKVRPIDFSSNSGGVRDAYVKDILLELSNTATAYEPYVEPQTHNIYLDAPLRKIGEYADYIDFDKGVVVRNVGKSEFVGATSEAWYRESYRLFIYTNALSSMNPNKLGCLSNYLRGQTWQNLWSNIEKAEGNFLTGVALQASGVINVTPYQTTPTVAEWKAQLQQWNEEGNPFTAWYVQAATEEAIELPKLPTFKGTTIYEVDTTIAATVSGKYKKTEE